MMLKKIAAPGGQAASPRPARRREAAFLPQDDWRARRRFGWVTSHGRSLATRVDHPNGPVAGALVIAPSAGREAVVSFRATRALAVHAARAGFVSFSFAWSGQGDSGDLLPTDDLAEAWTADLAAVVSEARALVGSELPVHVVGLRAGAGFVTRVHDHGPGVRILWEPISGAAFLKHHRLIRTGSIGVPVSEDGVELEDMWFSQAQADSLATVRIPRRSSNLPPDVTIRTETDRRAGLRIALGAPYFAHVPLAAIDEIVAGLPRGPERGGLSWDGPATARFVVGDHVVEETCVAVGRHGLPGILTTAPGITPHIGLVFSAMGAENRFGPGRLWVTAARELAPLGARGIRVDRSEMGEDADPDRSTEPPPYTDAGVVDASDAAHFLRADGLRPLGVGLCAGAWSLLRAVTTGALTGVLAINPVHWNPDEGVYDTAFYDHYHGTEAPALAAAGPSGGGGLRSRLLAGFDGARETVSRELAIRTPWLRSLMRSSVPVDRVSMILGHVPADAAVTLLLGPEEQRIFAGKGGRRAVRRARRNGALVCVGNDPSLDHSLFSRAGRERTLEALTAFVEQSR